MSQKFDDLPILNIVHTSKTAELIDNMKCRHYCYFVLQQFLLELRNFTFPNTTVRLDNKRQKIFDFVYIVAVKNVCVFNYCLVKCCSSSSKTNYYYFKK